MHGNQRNNGISPAESVATQEELQLYISTGHMLSLGSSIANMLNCAGRYKLPETTRMAHTPASLQ